jgi:hypothetical protein
MGRLETHTEFCEEDLKVETPFETSGVTRREILI